MVFESEFYHSGLLRWNLGWVTPNYAGAFLATLLVLFWALRGRRWLTITGLGIEALLTFLFIKTYSRGALVALGAAAVYFFLVQGLITIRAQWRLWLLRFLFVGGCLIVTGFCERLAPHHLGDDGAVVNRLTLWRGGLAMLAEAPFLGWGAGESGRAFMNWFQDIDRSESYTTMVNSYLHVGVEHGLIWLGLTIFGLLNLLLWPWAQRRYNRGEVNASSIYAGSNLRVKTAAGACWLTWAVANFFTTLWIEPRLWIVPLLAGFMIVCPLQASSFRRIRFVGLSAGGTTVLICVMLFIVSKTISSSTCISVHPRGDEVWMETKNTTAESVVSRWHVWPDEQVLGRCFGKELRRWLQESPQARCLIVHKVDSRSDESIYQEAPMLLFGRQCERVFWNKPVQCSPRGCVLMHPTVPPPDSSVDVVAGSVSMTVLLPEIDELGLNAVWQKWAESIGARVEFSPGVGLDIRTVWPHIMQTIEGTQR